MAHLTNNNTQICFTKNDLRSDFFSTSNAVVPSNKSAITKMRILTNTHVHSSALDSWIQRALKTEKLLQLKKGLYMTSNSYIHEPDKAKLSEYLSSQIYQPSYISLEYALKKHDLLSQATVIALSSHETVKTSSSESSSTSQPWQITSITTKPTRTFQNFSGTYRYSNIKSSLYIENNDYIGYEEHTFHGHAYHIATKAKALFDYLYLKSNLKRRNTKHLRHQLFEESGINWANFSEEDFKEFSNYVWHSNSKKMMRIRDVLNNYFENKKFDAWEKELLG